MDNLAIIIALAVVLWGNKLPSGVSDVLNFDKLYKKYGLKYNVDWKLLKAIAQVESDENPLAKNPNEPSYGLMQIFYPQSLNVENWPPQNAAQLYNPDYNISIGAQILRWNIASFGRDKGIAVYNAWSARHAPDQGPFPNQAYVDKVKGKLAALES